MQVEKGPRVNYKITTLKLYLKMERVDKEKFLDRLSELSDEAFTFKRRHDI